MYFLLAIVFILSSGHPNNYPYKAYYNARFDFCIEYPKTFISQPEPENRDGLVFLSPDKKTEIRTWGSLAIEDFDRLDQEFKTATSDLKITYKKITKSWFAFSGLDKKGNVVYQKTRKRKINYFNQGKQFVFNTLMITYPASQRNKYTGYTELILKISKASTSYLEAVNSQIDHSLIDYP